MGTSALVKLVVLTFLLMMAYFHASRRCSSWGVGGSLILLMVQKSGGNAPVEVGSLSHYLQGFIIHPNGGGSPDF